MAPMADSSLLAITPSNAALVDSQFATLESPVGEAGVLRLDALLDLPTLQQQASRWLATKEAA